jgi:hypothetical protein
MADDGIRRILSRLDVLETSNRLKGGHDYPAIPSVWVPNVSQLDASTGGWVTSSTSAVTIFSSYVTMQNPKMAFRFTFRNSVNGVLAAWNIQETTSGVTIATGNSSVNTFTVVELHIDTSQFFDYGNFSNYILQGLTGGGGTFACRADYIGGSWLPDTAVAP